MLKTLKNKILATLLLFSLVLVAITVLNIYYFSQKAKIDSFVEELGELQTLMLQDSKVISDFFTYEPKNPLFFTTSNSRYIKMHDSLIREIKASIINIQSHKYYDLFQLSNIKSIKKQIDLYDHKLKYIAGLILKRGFKDYGVEGEMRNCIHQIERIPYVDLSQVLTLRRHEKDFIIRYEDKYVKKLLESSAKFRRGIIKSKLFDRNQKKEILRLLESYENLFLELVGLEREIGIKDNTAIKQKIEETKSDILIGFETTISVARNINNRIANKMKVSFIVLTIGFITLGIVFSFVFSKHLTKRLSLLSENISQFVKNGFTDLTLLAINESDDEIGQLIRNYRIMKHEIIVLVHEFQKKVEERTQEIKAQKDKIDQQNKDILDSIHYAKRIQEALLPEKAFIDKIIPEHFILYKPKDIISGDFYWLKRLKNKKNIFVLAVADCTGHGIPGAFMSVLGVTLLNEIATKKKVKNAGNILDELRQSIITNLQQRDNKQTTADGMDIALCIFNLTDMTLEFAGANRPLYIIRKGNIIKTKGDRMPVGKYINTDNSFKSHLINLQSGDNIYLASDGYSDQFGGINKRKFMIRGFENQLLCVYHQPMHRQKEILNENILSWQANNSQTDDILVIGMKI